METMDYILPHGKVNLKTKSNYGNGKEPIDLVNDWNEGDDTCELWMNIYTGTYKVVRGSGDDEYRDELINNEVRFNWRHDQTNRKLGVYKMIDYTKLKEMDKWIEVTGKKLIGIACYK